ncbi:AAA ATPase [Blomia tropicalis]|nr:AAA ATPase [Blomia tropicalis]
MTSPRKSTRTSRKLFDTPTKLKSTTPVKSTKKQAKPIIQSPFMKAKKVLTTSASASLVGRDDEFIKIFDLVRNSLEDRRSLAMYVSGPAGTGKTLTVNTVLQRLNEKLSFKLIQINCMSFETLANFYEIISTQFTGSSPKKARRNFDSNVNNDPMTKIKDSISQHKQMTILVLDEVDQLKSKNNEVLRNIFKLPSIIPNNLILIGISNALDFTAKMVWLKELDKSNFHELRFMPYNKEQIIKIIENRLQNSEEDENSTSVIDKLALDYCARKIASCSGDIRKALDVCRRAIELVEGASKKKGLARSLDFGVSPLKNTNQNNVGDENTLMNGSNHVDLSLMVKTLNKVYGGVVDKLDNETKVHLPSDQQLILVTMLLLLKIKSIRDVRLADCRQALTKICAKKAITTQGKSESDILTMCQLLADYGYLTVKNDTISGGCASPFGRSPGKLMINRTPSKRKPVVLSLRIDPNETEQLLSTFHKSILSNGASLLI